MLRQLTAGRYSREADHIGLLVAAMMLTGCKKTPAPSQEMGA